ncbi:MAG: MinD/ParA family protein [Oscillospiraceae bacterium]|jgi:flagellar biosynthesis protein FlhG|nr:MinD/ParA family protein [Oscillospiraceae bacterium]
MNDQASALRQIVQNIKNQRARAPSEGARVVCVTSGKGGVGKTNFTVNLAISLSKKGLRVLIIDADFGLANVDVIMGVTPQYDLSHVIRHEVGIKEAMFEGPNGVRIISGGSGVLDLLNLSEAQLSTVVDKLLCMEDVADVILFDTGAGVSPNILRLIGASEEVIVITTPEPTAIMDAYALIKTVLTNSTGKKIRLVVNKAESIAEAHDTMAKFAGVVRLYLKTEVEELGYMLSDPTVARAVRLQRPFVASFPKSQVTRDIEAITWKFMDSQPAEEAKGLRRFFGNLMNRAK